MREGAPRERGHAIQSRTNNKIIIKEQIRQKSLAQSLKCTHKSPHLDTPTGIYIDAYKMYMVLAPKRVDEKQPT